MTPTPSPLPTGVAESTPWLTPSLVVSVLSFLISAGALFVTIRLFWWMHLRRGKLISASPHTFAGTFQNRRLVITLPLVIHNDGAKLIVVQDFRLRLEGLAKQNEGQQDVPPMDLSWSATRTKVNPSQDEPRILPAVFPVLGRTAEVKFIEFSRRELDTFERKGPRPAVVEVRTADQGGWKHLASFDLHTERIGDAYTALSNDPEWQK